MNRVDLLASRTPLERFNVKTLREIKNVKKRSMLLFYDILLLLIYVKK